MNSSLFLPNDGRCLPQSLDEWLQDSEALELGIDIAAERQRYGIERQLRTKLAMEETEDAGIRHGRRRVMRGLLAKPFADITTACNEILDFLQGGAASQDRSARPATNPNTAPEVVSQVNPHPKGRWP